MDYIKIYLDDLRLSKSPRTLANYQHALKKFQEHTQKPPETASKADILGYLNKLMDNGLDRSTVKTVRAQLSAFYSWMVLEKYLVENPMARVGKVLADKKLPVYLTLEEIKAMIEVAPVVHRRCPTMIRILYLTGVRVSELVHIRKKDLELDSAQLNVFGKGAKERAVMIPGWFVAELEEYSKTLADNEYLFSISTTTVERDIRKIGSLASIPKKVTPHKLRHSFATHMAQNNANLEAIRKLLGHTSLTTTQQYMHLANKDVHDQIAASHPGYKGRM